MKTVRHEQVPIETPRPTDREGAATNDTYISRQEELTEVMRDIVFSTLIKPGHEEELWEFLKLHSYKMKTWKNAKGEDEFIGIEDSRGQLVWLVDFDWYRKIQKLEESQKPTFDRRATLEESHRAAETNSTKVIEVKPETDPQKIN